MATRPAFDRRTTEEWEAEFGRAVRVTRRRAGLTQDELARSANVSISSIKNLEKGLGSTLKTVIRVSRALGRQDWLESFEPPLAKISPMEVLMARPSADVE